MPFRVGQTRATSIGARQSLKKSKHGAEEVGHVEPERRMFWARLQLKSLKKPIFVATAHLTSRLHGDEMETGISPRVRQLKRIVEALNRLVSQGEPGFFMGDMNDPWHPQHVLQQVGFDSCFAALGMKAHRPLSATQQRMFNRRANNHRGDRSHYRK